MMIILTASSYEPERFITINKKFLCYSKSYKQKIFFFLSCLYAMKFFDMSFGFRNEKYCFQNV